MTTLRQLWMGISALFLGGVGSYFAYHSIYGKRGYYVWQDNRIVWQEKERQLAGLEQTYLWLANQTRLLRDDSLDLGVLSQWLWEVGRKLDPNAKVILTPPRNKPPLSTAPPSPTSPAPAPLQKQQTLPVRTAKPPGHSKTRRKKYETTKAPNDRLDNRRCFSYHDIENF